MTQRVSTLSGYEQNRLLLAKLFAQSHNFLVLDEPTNDLDIETLELLQEVITDYDGTVLIVSHDRDFLDRTVTGILAFEGNAKSWPMRWLFGLSKPKKCQGPTTAKLAQKRKKVRIKQTQIKPAGTVKLSRKHLLNTLPDEIAALETDIASIEAQLAVQNLFQTNPTKFSELANNLTLQRDRKESKEMEWLKIAEKAESIEQARPEGQKP